MIYISDAGKTIEKKAGLPAEKTENGKKKGTHEKMTKDKGKDKVEHVIEENEVEDEERHNTEMVDNAKNVAVEVIEMIKVVTEADAAEDLLEAATDMVDGADAVISAVPKIKSFFPKHFIKRSKNKKEEETNDEDGNRG